MLNFVFSKGFVRSWQRAERMGFREKDEPIHVWFSCWSKNCNFEVFCQIVYPLFIPFLFHLIVLYFLFPSFSWPLAVLYRKCWKIIDQFCFYRHYESLTYHYCNHLISCSRIYNSLNSIAEIFWMLKRFAIPFHKKLGLFVWEYKTDQDWALGRF